MQVQNTKIRGEVARGNAQSKYPDLKKKLKWLIC